MPKRKGRKAKNQKDRKAFELPLIRMVSLERKAQNSPCQGLPQPGLRLA